MSSPTQTTLPDELKSRRAQLRPVPFVKRPEPAASSLKLIPPPPSHSTYGSEEKISSSCSLDGSSHRPATSISGPAQTTVHSSMQRTAQQHPLSQTQPNPTQT
ncbi:hypothetical protein KC19_7G006600, partial [Ceratodon purpureus]